MNYINSSSSNNTTTNHVMLSHKHRLLSQAESGYSTTSTSSEDGGNCCHVTDDVTTRLASLRLADDDPLAAPNRRDAQINAPTQQWHKEKHRRGSLHSDMSSFDLDDSHIFESPPRRSHVTMTSSVIGSSNSAFSPVISSSSPRKKDRSASSSSSGGANLSRLLDFVEAAGSELVMSSSPPAPAPQPRRKSASSSSSPVKHKSRDLVAAVSDIRATIEHASGSDLKRLLKRGLQSRDPQVLDTLGMLIGQKGAPLGPTLAPTAVQRKKRHQQKRQTSVPTMPVSCRNHHHDDVMEHCVRCHKSFDPREKGNCNVPHPEAMVVVVGGDEHGTDFVCRCCRKGFRLFKMDFYEESTNSLLTGHCYSGQHTTDPARVRYQDRGGAARTCPENGCVEFYV